MRVFAGSEKIVIISPNKIVRDKSTPTPEKIEALRANIKANINQELANELTDAYGSDYKIRVKYKYLGLAD